MQFNTSQWFLAYSNEISLYDELWMNFIFVVGVKKGTWDRMKGGMNIYIAGCRNQHNICSKRTENLEFKGQ